MNHELQKQTATLAGRAWSGFALAALVLFFCSMYTVLLSLVQFVKLSEAQQIVFQTVLFHWCGLLFIAGHARVLGLGGAELYGLSGHFFRRIGQSVKYYLGMVLVVIVGAVGWGNLLKLFGHEPELQDVVTVILNAEPVALKGYLIFLAVVLAPVFEELVFRGILFPVLVKRMPARTAAWARLTNSANGVTSTSRCTSRCAATCAATALPIAVNIPNPKPAAARSSFAPITPPPTAAAVMS